MVVVLEVPRVLAGGCVTGRERGIRRGRGEERRVRGCKALVEPPGVGWAGAAGGLSGAAAERMCAAGAVDGAIRRDGPRATSSRPIAARTAGVSACVRGGVGGVSRVPGSVSVLASRRRRVAGGRRALPVQIACDKVESRNERKNKSEVAGRPQIHSELDWADSLTPIPVTSSWACTLVANSFWTGPINAWALCTL